jgi:hypothetical protein
MMMSYHSHVLLELIADPVRILLRRPEVAASEFVLEGLILIHPTIAFQGRVHSAALAGVYPMLLGVYPCPENEVAVTFVPGSDCGDAPPPMIPEGF